MNTIHLTDEQLEIAHQGMSAFLHDFGHDEADTVRAIRGVLAALDAAQSDDAPVPA